jgi:hypothetical protein
MIGRDGLKRSPGPHRPGLRDRGHLRAPTGGLLLAARQPKPIHVPARCADPAKSEIHLDLREGENEHNIRLN